MTYHAVRERESGIFEQQMEILLNLATPVFADERSQPNARARVAVTFDDAFQSAVQNALPFMVRKQIPATIFVPTSALGMRPPWIRSKREHENFDQFVISRDELSSLDQKHLRLGSHTANHLYLPNLDESQLSSELQSSKDWLEDITGYEIKMLSLPYGAFNEKVISTSLRVGYQNIFTNIPIRRRSPSIMGRIDVSPTDTLLEFKLKLLGAYDWLAFGIPIKRALIHALCSS
jgi:peptidoglycan/xylan/chitin deacetylase (PgdA/CDA1 family)